MDPIEALLLPVPEDERMKALARTLRGRQVAADFFAGSTIPALQRIAQGEQEYIKDVAARQGVLREALDRRKQDQAQFEEAQALRETIQKQNQLYQEAIIRDMEKPESNVSAAGKAPSGYMFVDPENPSAGLIPIPGGPAELKHNAAVEKQAKADQVTLDMMDNMQRAINKARSVANPYTTNVLGRVGSKFLRPDRVALEQSIDTLKANLSFETLKNIKQSSETGSGLGPTSDLEITLMASTVAGLNPDLSDDELIENLGWIEGQLKKWGYPGLPDESGLETQKAAAQLVTPQKAPSSDIGNRLEQLNRRQAELEAFLNGSQ